MSKKEKKKKEKIIYYDDGSTIIDMSSVNKKGVKQEPKPSKPPSSASDRWRTYWNSVGMMMKPMFFVLGIIAILYVLIMLLIGGF